MDLMGGLGKGLENFISTYTGLKQNEDAKKRQGVLDRMNFESHSAQMENQALQRALQQAQLEAMPKKQAVSDIEDMLKVQGDKAYDNPAFASAATRAGLPFETKQVPLESRNVIDKALNMGPMNTKEHMARSMGVAPNTGVVLPDEVRVRGAQNRQKESAADFLTRVLSESGGNGLKDTPENRIAVSQIPGLTSNEVFGTAKGSPIPVMHVNPRTGKMESMGEAPGGSHFVNEPAPRDPVVAELAAQRLQDAKDKNAPVDVTGSVRTTISGRKYVDLGDYQTPAERSKAQKAAEAAGVPAVSKEVGASLAAADTAKQNLTAMLSVIENKLPKDAQGRVIAGPGNRLSQFFQTDKDLAAFNSWRAGAIQAVQALVERGMGFRLNQAEINLIMQNDMPQITDTVGVAQQRVANVLKLIESKENSALVKDRSSLNTPSQPKGTMKTGRFEVTVHP